MDFMKYLCIVDELWLWINWLVSRKCEVKMKVTFKIKYLKNSR